MGGSRAATRRSSTGSPTRIRARGGQVLTSTPGALRPVREPPRDRRRARRRASARTTRSWPRRSAPTCRTCWRPSSSSALGPDRQRYLGIVCLVARVRAQRQPVLRAEHHRPPGAAHERRRDDARRRPGGRRGPPLYLPKYVNPDSPELEKSSARHPQRVPRPPEGDVPRRSARRTSSPRRSRAPASPSRSTRSARAKPDPFAVPGLVVASSAQVYPDIVHGQAILGVAERVAAALEARCPCHSAAWRRHDHEHSKEERTMTPAPDDRGDGRRRLHRRQPRRAPARRGLHRRSASTTCRWARCATWRACSTTRNFRFERVRLPRRRAHARGDGRLRRDRPHGGAEDPPLRRGARRRCDVNVDGSHVALELGRETGAHVVLASTSDVYGQADPAVRRGRPDRARPADDPPLVVRRVEVLRRAPRAADGRGGGPEGHHPALLQRLRRPQPPVVVGRPAVGVLRGPARRPRDGAARRRPPDPLVHLRERHGRRRRPRARAAGDLGRGHQHRQRPADRDRRPRAARSRRPMGIEGPLRARIVAARVDRRQLPGRPRTACRTSPRRARLLGFEPQVSLEEGLAQDAGLAPAPCARRPSRSRERRARRHVAAGAGGGLPARCCMRSTGPTPR